jgi:hypothetical protein
VKFKGIAFPSFFNQNTEPKQKLQWIAHSGIKARLRNMRQVVRRYLNSTDPDIVAAVKRVVEATANEPHPEFGKLHLMFAAHDAHEQTGEPWHKAMNYFLDKFEDIKRDALEAERAAAQ